jgi:thymidylate synthase
MIKTFANKFRNADEAFQYWYQCIEHYGTDFAGTKALFNVGFQIDNPTNNIIKSPWRNWKHNYAKAEWRWYESGDRNIKKLGKLYGKVPEIWKRMADAHGNVNSNYGWQWGRNSQIDYVLEKLRRNPNTRQATISIYDGKEHSLYERDTPCTYAIQFTVVNNHLNMCVTMRSNDLWFGFCNDQYCFSELQKLVAEETDYDIGTYYHFAHNLHLYERDLGKFLTTKTKGPAQSRADKYGR